MNKIISVPKKDEAFNSVQNESQNVFKEYLKEIEKVGDLNMGEQNKIALMFRCIGEVAYSHSDDSELPHFISEAVNFISGRGRFFEAKATSILYQMEFIISNYPDFNLVPLTTNVLNNISTSDSPNWEKNLVRDMFFKRIPKM